MLRPASVQCAVLCGVSASEFRSAGGGGGGEVDSGGRSVACGVYGVRAVCHAADQSVGDVRDRGAPAGTARGGQRALCDRVPRATVAAGQSGGTEDGRGNGAVSGDWGVLT